MSHLCVPVLSGNWLMGGGGQKPSKTRAVMTLDSSELQCRIRKKEKRYLRTPTDEWVTSK